MADGGVPLTAAEIGALWALFMDASANECMIIHLYGWAGDEECRAALGRALEYLPVRRRKIAALFEAEAVPLPLAFGEEDVDRAAPRLFSDVFALDYLRTRGAVSVGSLAFSLHATARPDVADFLRRELGNSLEANRQATDECGGRRREVNRRPADKRVRLAEQGLGYDARRRSGRANRDSEIQLVTAALFFLGSVKGICGHGQSS